MVALVAGIMTLGRRLTPNDSGGPLAAAARLTLAVMLLFIAMRALRSGTFEGDRFATFCLRFVAVAAAAIAGLHFSGQLFAAHVYLRALYSSVGAVLLTLLLVSMLQRILQLYRFGLQQRTRELEREIEEDEDSEVTEEERASREETLASLTEAHTQLLVLLRFATLGTLLWMIWSPALPALSFLDSIVLWSTSDIVDTEIGRLLTSQPRPPCGAVSDYGAELWRAGGRSDAKGLGLDCHEGRLS